MCVELDGVMDGGVDGTQRERESGIERGKRSEVGLKVCPST